MLGKIYKSKFNALGLHIKIQKKFLKCKVSSMDWKIVCGKKFVQTAPL